MPICGDPHCNTALGADVIGITVTLSSGESIGTILLCAIFFFFLLLLRVTTDDNADVVAAFRLVSLEGVAYHPMLAMLLCMYMKK